MPWQVNNSNAFDISFVWWVVGGSATGGPIVVPASTSLTFETPVEGSLPNQIAIMWFDPSDGSFKTVTGSNDGTLCDGGTPESPTSTPSATPDVLIPVTGIDISSIFRDNMFLNMGIGVFGFALIMLGIGIKLDRGRSGNTEEEDEEEYED